MGKRQTTTDSADTQPVDPVMSMQELAELILNIMRASPVPECTKEEYCRGTGVKAGVLQGWVNKGLIPTVKRGKHCLINLAAITAENIRDMSLSQPAKH